MLWQPDGNGWKFTGEEGLAPIMYLKDSAPIEVRDLTHLYCLDYDCHTSKCHCVGVGLKCTEFCACNTEECYNKNDINIASDDDSSDNKQ